MVCASMKVISISKPDRTRPARLRRMLGKMKEDEFIWMKGNLQDVQKKEFREKYGVEVTTWPVNRVWGVLIYYPSLFDPPKEKAPVQAGVEEVGKEGSVQGIFGLPDFCRPISG